MAAYNKFETFVGDLGLGAHNLNTDTLKAYLTNATPSPSADSVLLDLADISAGNGYTAGGTDLVNTYSETAGTGTLAGTNPVWTASGGTIGPFRYSPWYNDTQTSPADPLGGWWDYGSAVTLNSGETFTLNLGSGSGTILTIT